MALIRKSNYDGSSGKRGRNKVRVVFRRMTMGIAAFLILIGILMGTVGNLGHKSYLAALLGAGILVGGLAFLREKSILSGAWLSQRSPFRICLLLTVLCLVLNGAWVMVFHPVQAPDYQTFYQAASDLACSCPLTGKDYIALFPHILGYAAFLSIFFRLFGESLMTAAIVNVLLTTTSGILLYALCFRYYGRKAAFMAFFLWVICPSKLLYNAMTLSEPFYTCLLLLFLLLVSETMDVALGKGNLGRITVAGILSGLVLAMVNASRPIGIVPIIAFFVWLLFLSDWHEIRIRKTKVFLFAGMLLMSYIVAGCLWKSYAAAHLEQEPPSVPGYSIYVGFNSETQGSYADEDMDLLQDRYFGEYDRNAEAAQQSMLESAKKRISENRDGIPHLMLQKLGTLLGHDEGGAFYSKESLSDGAYSAWCMISNVWYYFVCIVAIAGCLRLWKQARSDSILIVPLCMIGVILAQMLVEVAARYHYCLIPLLLLLTGSVLEGIKKEA